MDQKTIKNHINPQGLLGFWTIDELLKCFNKCSGRILDMIPSAVCFEKNFLSQKLEDEFARWPDADIKREIDDILQTKNISNKNKFYIGRFLAYQKLRDPFFNKVMEGIVDKFMKDAMRILKKSAKELSFEIQYLALYNNAIDLIGYFVEKKWKLLDFNVPCLITNEAIYTPQLENGIYNDSYEIYFPITPQYCIVISKEEINHIPDIILANHINNLLANWPDSNWIIFNNSFNPMENISIFNKK